LDRGLAAPSSYATFFGLFGQSSFLGRKEMLELDAMIAEVQATTAEELLERFSDLENYLEEPLAPYQEIRVGVNTYYFTPGGFLYCKDPGTEEVWHYRTDDS
jgi:hypothetical protein